MLKRMDASDTLIAFDRDSENIREAEAYIATLGITAKHIFIHASFASLREELEKIGIDHIDFILYDLGVSSVHYDIGDRGFSTRFDGPLDMRFDRTHGKTASDLVMTLEDRELVRIFSLYGEEKKAWFIVNAIVKERKENTIDTTAKLLTLIANSSYDPKSPIRVFQALRIAVNEEFSHIEDSLPLALDLLSPSGLIAVITFHSLEDRLVKHTFEPFLEDVIDDITGQIRIRAKYKKYTKKPIEPTEEEIARNPRSRSAKMRIIQKI